jgi:signal transduction histidine kinase
LYWQLTKQVVLQQNPNTGRLLADQVIVLCHYERFYEGEQFTEVVENLREVLSQQAYTWRVIRRPASPFLPVVVADAPEEPLDDFEMEAMTYFAQNPPADGAAKGEIRQYRERLVEDGDEYEYYQPIWAQESCLVCHRGVTVDPLGTGLGIGGGGEKAGVGDLMAMAKVTIPNDATKADISWYWNTLLAVSIITAFLAMIAFYVTIRYVIVRPLRHLRQVSDAITHGEIAMRAEIRTGDEFETLGVAFNRMLGHLVTVQDELRQVNVDLDVKVDELAQLNMQLYETNRIKSDFLATMSHELRTPLNSILGFSDVLGSIDSLDAKQKRYVENIRKSGRMLLEMINSILDLAKIESGRMEVRPSEFGIAAVVGAQCDMARPLTEKRNIDLVAEVSRDLPPMHQDQARVQQILNNLLSNAIKFTPEGGRIRVSAMRDESGELVMQVADTGVGIAKEDQQAIFEKFRQGRTAMPGGDAITREYSGTGLGLSIVKELCKLLEGEVWVQSELGMGSTFTVRLPWDLRARPRHERPLTAGFEELGKLRIDAARERPPEPLSARTSGDSSEGDA